MLQYIKDLLGIGKRKKLLLDAIRRKAYIIDVRTPQEYRMGHIQQAVNIPLELISKNADKIRKMKPLSSQRWQVTLTNGVAFTISKRLAPQVWRTLR